MDSLPQELELLIYQWANSIIYNEVVTDIWILGGRIEMDNYHGFTHSVQAYLENLHIQKLMYTWCEGYNLKRIHCKHKNYGQTTVLYKP